jgi:hypothetical protein
MSAVHLGRLGRALVLATAAGAILVLFSSVRADNIDQTTAGRRYAWGENVGWLSARPNSESYGPGGAGAQVHDTEVTGYLWGENIGWINLSCQNDSTCAGPAGNWGVKNDGAGHLSGYAWGENVGWINFSCTTDATCGGGAGSWGVQIDNYSTDVEHAQAGTFSGYAWGENIGWINFSCSNQGTCASVDYGVQTGAPDSDGDGYTDAQEAVLSKDPFAYCSIMRADVTGDGKISIIDLSSIAFHYNQSVPTVSARFDQDGNGKINIIDLSSAAGVYNQSVSACP